MPLTRPPCDPTRMDTAHKLQVQLRSIHATVAAVKFPLHFVLHFYSCFHAYKIIFHELIHDPQGLLLVVVTESPR
jgi:hypothetical protein